MRNLGSIDGVVLFTSLHDFLKSQLRDLFQPKQQNPFLSGVSGFRFIPERFGGLTLASLFAAKDEQRKTI